MSGEISNNRYRICSSCNKDGLILQSHSHDEISRKYNFKCKYCNDHITIVDNLPKYPEEVKL